MKKFLLAGAAVVFAGIATVAMAADHRAPKHSAAPSRATVVTPAKASTPQKASPSKRHHAAKRHHAHAHRAHAK